MGGQDMSQAYRVNGGAARFVNDGLAGSCLSESTQEYTRGYNTFSNGQLPALCATRTFMQGYKRAKKDAKLFNENKEIYRTMVSTGLSKKEVIRYRKATM